ncbi:MAG: hypothetical protein AAGF12_11625 [Myxococcota bacterium]
MAEFQIKVRKMDTGEALVATLDSFEDAITFVTDRPEFMEILGVISDASASEHRRLKEAMRPYSEEETTLRKKLEAEHLKSVREMMEKQQRLDALAQEKARREAAAADPNRPMEVLWDALDGYSLADAFDPREIPDVVKDAIAAWVAERNGWIEAKGQIVGEARIAVYPGPIPDGEERILEGGQFTPRLKE